MAAKKDTPASRARSRHDPAVFTPPPRNPISRTGSIRTLHLRARGRAYMIGGHIEGSTPWSMGMDQTDTVSVVVRDPQDSLMDVLTDENLLQQEGVSVTIDGTIYMVSGVDGDGEGAYTLTLEDETSWRLKLFDSYKSASRASVTRYGFILGFVDEASRKPYPKMRAFIPEADDKQPIRKAKKKKKKAT